MQNTQQSGATVLDYFDNGRYEEKGEDGKDGITGGGGGGRMSNGEIWCLLISVDDGGVRLCVLTFIVLRARFMCVHRGNIAAPT